MSNTIIADNVDTGGEAPDCIGPIDSRGHNLIENTAACALVGGSADITGQDPKLGPPDKQRWSYRNACAPSR